MAKSVRFARYLRSSTNCRWAVHFPETITALDHTSRLVHIVSELLTRGRLPPNDFARYSAQLRFYNFLAWAYLGEIDRQRCTAEAATTPNPYSHPRVAAEEDSDGEECDNDGGDDDGDDGGNGEGNDGGDDADEDEQPITATDKASADGAQEPPGKKKRCDIPSPPHLSRMLTA